MRSTVAVALISALLALALTACSAEYQYDHDAQVRAALSGWDNSLYFEAAAVAAAAPGTAISRGTQVSRLLLQAAPPPDAQLTSDNITHEALASQRNRQESRLENGRSGTRGATIAAVGGASAASIIVSTAAASATAQAVNLAVSGATSSAMESATELASTAVGGHLGPVRIAEIISRVTMRSGIDGALLPLGLGDIIYHVQFFVLSASMRIELSSYQEELARSLEWVLFQINIGESMQGYTSIYNVTRTIDIGEAKDTVYTPVRRRNLLMGSRNAEGLAIISEPKSREEYIYKLAGMRLIIISAGFAILLVLHWLVLHLWHPFFVSMDVCLFVLCCKNRVQPIPKKLNEWDEDRPDPMEPPRHQPPPQYMPPNMHSYTGNAPQYYNYPTSYLAAFPVVAPAVPAATISYPTPFPEVVPLASAHPAPAPPTYHQSSLTAPSPPVPPSPPPIPQPGDMAPFPPVPSAPPAYPQAISMVPLPPVPPQAVLPPPAAPPMPTAHEPIRIQVRPSSSSDPVSKPGPVAESDEDEVINSKSYFNTVGEEIKSSWERFPIPSFLAFPRLEIMYLDVALLGATQAGVMLLCTGEVRYMWPAFIVLPIIILYYFLIAGLILIVTRDQKYYHGMGYMKNKFSDPTRSFFMEWLLFWRSRGTWGSKTLNILHKSDKEPHRSKHLVRTGLNIFFLVRLLNAHNKYRYDAKAAWDAAASAREEALLKKHSKADDSTVVDIKGKVDLLLVEKLQLLGFEVQERLGDLYEDYTSDAPWWKLVEMLVKITIASITGVGVGAWLDPRSDAALGLSAGMLGVVLAYAALTTFIRPRIDFLRGIAEFCCLWFEVAAMALVLAMQLTPAPGADLIEATLPTPPATPLQMARFALQLAAVVCAIIFILFYGLIFKIIAFKSSTKTMKTASIAVAVAVHDDDERERLRAERELNAALMRESAAQYASQAQKASKQEADNAQQARIACEAAMATVLACTNSQAASEALQVLMKATNDATYAAKRAAEAAFDAMQAANNSDPGEFNASPKEQEVYKAALATAAEAEKLAAEAESSRLKAMECLMTGSAHCGKLRSDELSGLQAAADAAAAAAAAEEERRLKEEEEEAARRKAAMEEIARMEEEEAAKKAEEERLRREAQEAAEKKKVEEAEELARKAAEAAEAARVAAEDAEREMLSTKRHEFIEGAYAAAMRGRNAANEAERQFSSSEKEEEMAERLTAQLEDDMQAVERRKKAADAEPQGDAQAMLERVVCATEDARSMLEKANKANDEIKAVSDRAEAAAEAAEAEVAKAQQALQDAHNAAAWITTLVQERRISPPEGTATEAELEKQTADDEKVKKDKEEASSAVKEAEEYVAKALAAAKAAGAAAVKSKVALKKAGRIKEEAERRREEAEEGEEKAKKVHAKALNKMTVANAMKNTVHEITAASMAKVREEAKKRFEEQAKLRQEAEERAEAERIAKRDAARAGKKLPAYMRSTKVQKGMQKDPREEALTKQKAEEASEAAASATLQADAATQAATKAQRSAFARLVFGARNHVKAGGDLRDKDAEPGSGSRITGGVAAYSFVE